MAEVNSRFIPVSHLVMGTKVPGLIAKPAAQCERCDEQCIRGRIGELSICSYGLNYLRLSEEVLLFGFLVQGEVSSPAQAKALRQNPGSVIKRDLLNKSIEILRTDQEIFKNSRQKALDAIVEEYRRTSMFKVDFLEVLRPEMTRSLGFLHDYKQFVARVKQNINVVLQARYPNESLESQLARALPSEKAIYWAAALMEEKLHTALMLTQPESLASAPRTPFRLHAVVLKHIRIYQAAFDEKGIRVIQQGKSEGQIYAPRAFAAIPHTLLDNALKYSQRGGQVVIRFDESESEIELSVTSHGPKIVGDEIHQIFELFKRGAAASVQEEEGSGIGLYLAQFMAHDLGTQITVHQAHEKTKFGYETTFSIRLKRIG